MSKLNTMEKVVLKVLEEQPETRKDDYLLLYAICMELGVDIIGRTFMTVMRHHSELNIPNWKTVERCRRKIQRSRPELKDPETAEERRREEKEYKEYSRG